MKDLFLLDCTLRDGGYLNDWRFGHDNLVSIFERLVDANVDIIEIGFLDDRRPFDIDRSIMPDTESAGKIFEGLDRKQAMVVGMIDYGTCSIDNLQPCNDSFLDGIRVIFKKHNMHPAMEFCSQVKALGYKVFAQLVSVTSYSDEELAELIELANDVKPYAVSMVDTYGLMYPENVKHYYSILEEKLDEDIIIGFHSHNNLQLAFANDLTLIEQDSKHRLVVDGTLFGMGKSAGNAPIELIATTLNEKLGGDYRIDPMLEAIEESLMDFYSRTPWGYKEFFYLCAKNRCHPNYVTYFREKNNLSSTKIDILLSQIEPEEKKLLFDKEVAEKIYQDFIDGEYSDYKDRIAFAEETSGRKILVIGPGKNISLQEKKVADFIKKNDPYIISINYLPEKFTPDCIFVTNSKRYHDMTLQIKDMLAQNIKFLATSNVECRNGKFDFMVNRAPLLETSESIIDNSFLMLIKFLKSVDISEVFCAGFDGYSDKESNYCDPAMEYGFVKQEATHLNDHMKRVTAELRNSMDIQFITYSAYDEVEDINGASI